MFLNLCDANHIVWICYDGIITDSYSCGEGVVDLKFWHWFCKLGTEKNNGQFTTGQPSFVPMKVSAGVSQSGVDMVCSRVCGQNGCQCGSTARGLHCVWSYYRLE